MKKNIAIFSGDGIGPEITNSCLKVLKAIDFHTNQLNFIQGLIGGAAFEAHGYPLPAESLTMAKSADAILFGAVGDPKYDNLNRDLRPEQAILGLRKELSLYVNLRPAKVFTSLLSASTIKSEVLKNTDILIVRELLEDVYFGEPRGILNQENDIQAVNTMVYHKSTIQCVAKLSFELANNRKQKVTSIDKANVLEVSELWRQSVNEIAREFPNIQLNHMYVDNASMQLIKCPSEFDVILCGNLFGDILSDEAAMITGSIGLIPSASLNQQKKGLYEPIHGSAPDIAGKGIANPIATILSAAMMFRYSLADEQTALKIEKSVEKTLDQGFRTEDIFSEGNQLVNCEQMTDQIIVNL